MSNLSIKHGENHTNISSISLHSLDWTRWEILLTNSLHSRTAGYSSVNHWYFWLLWRISFGVFIGDFMKELFEFLYSRWRYPKINLPNVYIWQACSSARENTYLLTYIRSHQHNHSPFLCSTKVKAKMSKHINENWYPNCIGFFCSQFIFYFYFWLFSANLFSVLTVEVSKNQFTECLHLASLQFWSSPGLYIFDVCNVVKNILVMPEKARVTNFVNIFTWVNHSF